jgi:FAS-associated factor 2
MLVGYEEFLKVCQDEARLGCVMLVTDEHDDVAEFKRSTLINPALNKLLLDNNFAVWGGDVREREAWSAAQKLQATTYPFVAFLSLQPRRGSSARSTSSPTLTILSRHQGPATDNGPTSAERLCDHLERQLVPRAKPFLDRIHATRLERLRERRLREEQERAHAEAMRKDKERIEAKIAEVEAARLAKEAEAAAKREEEAEDVRRAEWADTKMAWRRYARARMVPPEPSVGQGRGSTRVMVRLPDGTRLVRTFGADADLTALYAYVDAAFIPSSMHKGGDPREPPVGIAEGEAGVVEQVSLRGSADAFWGFHLAFGFPRREVPWMPGKKIDSVEGFRGGGPLVVELVDQGAPRRKSGESARTKPVDHDGYDTESD